MTATTARVRPLARGVALAAFVLLASACSSDATTTQSTMPALTATSSVTVTIPATTVPVTAPVESIDPAGGLQRGLAALSTGYHFSSVVLVNGTQSLVADGDRVGDASRLVLTGDGGTVAYIITPEGSYAQPENGEWSVLDVAPATSDPITALYTPTAVALVPTADGSVVVRVTVSAVSLGIAAEGNVDVDVRLVGDAITHISYTAPVDGGTAQVVTVIGAVVDATPIVAPI